MWAQRTINHILDGVQIICSTVMAIFGGRCNVTYRGECDAACSQITLGFYVIVGYVRVGPDVCTAAPNYQSSTVASDYLCRRPK